MSQFTEDPNHKYDKSAMNKTGIPQNPEKCVEAVSSCGGWHFYQCSRKRGKGKGGLYCGQHAKRYPSEANSD